MRPFYKDPYFTPAPRRLVTSIAIQPERVPLSLTMYDRYRAMLKPADYSQIKLRVEWHEVDAVLTETIVALYGPNRILNKLLKLFDDLQEEKLVSYWTPVFRKST